MLKREDNSAKQIRKIEMAKRLFPVPPKLFDQKINRWLKALNTRCTRVFLLHALFEAL